VVDARTLHLLRRATYGPTPAGIAEATRLGRDAWLERQLSPSAISDRTGTALTRRFPGLGWSIARVRAEHADDFGSWDVMLQLSRATLARAIWSERQLFELMVEFWSNHLNVTNPSSDVWDNRAQYDRVIRRHALGSFTDLLVAATGHPAMQRYLDNASSDREHPNENHGRELLELHTIGAAALYGADDPEAAVKNSALILTGLTVDDVTGEPLYRPERHHVGRVQVLGFSHANASAAAGRDVTVAYLRYLARHPATAAAIARKLAVRFVSDDPPATLVSRLAQTYLDSGTAVVPVLRRLFRSREFAAAERRKVRRPYEDLVATVRVLGLGPDAKGTKGIEALHWMLADMGQAPLAWRPPNGFPDAAPAWQSAAGTLLRWNAHLNVAARWLPATLTGPALTALLPAKRPATHGALLDALAHRLLQRGLPDAQQVAVCDFLGVSPATALRADSAAIGWRLPYVVALLLDSPLFALR
jgi:uncharacterized protein (DUF1800 family)